MILMAWMGVEQFWTNGFRVRGNHDATDPQVVMRGLDPRIHRLRKKVFAEWDGLPGQARQ
jgi:hypothetical protein